MAHCVLKFMKLNYFESIEQSPTININTVVFIKYGKTYSVV